MTPLNHIWGWRGWMKIFLPFKSFWPIAKSQHCWGNLLPPGRSIHWIFTITHTFSSLATTAEHWLKPLPPSSHNRATLDSAADMRCSSSGASSRQEVRPQDLQQQSHKPSPHSESHSCDLLLFSPLFASVPLEAASDSSSSSATALYLPRRPFLSPS